MLLQSSTATKIGIFIVTALSIFAPIVPLMITCGIMIFFDFFTGIWKSKKRGEKITSSKMSNTISKMVLYQVALITAYVLELYILPFIPVSKIVAGFLATTEFKSLIENIGEITQIDIWNNIKKYFTKKSENDNGKKDK